jgi:hypothetical protein
MLRHAANLQHKLCDTAVHVATLGVTCRHPLILMVPATALRGRETSPGVIASKLGGSCVKVRMTGALRTDSNEVWTVIVKVKVGKGATTIE